MRIVIGVIVGLGCAILTADIIGAPLAGICGGVISILIWEKKK